MPGELPEPKESPVTALTPTPADVAQIIEKHSFTGKEFGEAIGYSDAERVTRALVLGERHGKPYHMTGTAVAAMNYMLVLRDLVQAHEDFRNDATPENEEALVDAHAAAIRALPDRLKPKD